MNWPDRASLPFAARTVVLLCLVLLGGVAAWVVTLVRERRWPAVPAWLLASVAAFLGWGGWLVANSGSRYDPSSLQLVPRRAPVDALPAGVDRFAGALTWLQAAAVLGAGVALVDVSRRRPARHAALAALAGAGGVVGWLGALDRFGVGPFRFRQRSLSGTHFAFFDYHANAAAFLDLALPAALAVAWHAWTSRRGAWSRPAATVALAGVLAGCATHVSKAGQVLAFAIVAGALVLVRRHARRRPTTSGRRSRTVSWIGAAAVASIVLVVGLSGAARRWRALPASLHSDNPRMLITEVGLHALARAPLSGSGPGSFKLLLPSLATAHVPELYRNWVVQPYERGAPVTMWMQAHDDPLQVLVEWGPVGLVAVVVIYAGPLVSGWRWRTRVADDDRHLVLAGATALLVTGAHALIDFPLRVLPNQLAAIVCGAVVLGACRAERVAEG